MRWMGMLVVVGWGILAGWCPVEAKDHVAAKSLIATGSASRVNYARTCAGQDLLGNWQLMTFDSSYRFKNPQAPYLFRHQVFQYSNRGGAKSVHSLRPILGNPNKVFEAVPWEMTYEIEPRGRVILKTKGQDDLLETWSCEVVTQDHETRGHGKALRRGDLIMTLRGSHGQALFVRHLRKSVA